MGVGASRRHEQEGRRYQMWHGYSFVRVMNSVNEGSLAAAGFLPPSRFFKQEMHILCIVPDEDTNGRGTD